MGVYSTQARYTGMSGVDTESMVQAMMKAESVKYDRLKQTGTRINWQQEAYRKQISSLQAFQKSAFDVLSTGSVRLPSTFNVSNNSVKVNGTDSKLVTVKGGGSVASGSYNMTVKQTASKDTFISADADGQAKVRANIKSESPIDVSQIIAGDSFNVAVDGVTRELKISQEDIDAISGGDPNKTTDEKFVEMLNSKLKSLFSDGANAKATASMTDGVLSFNGVGNHSIKITDTSGRNTAVKGNTDFQAISGKLDVTIQVGDKTVAFELEEGYSREQKIAATNYALRKNDITNVALSDVEGNLTFSAIGTTEDITISGMTSALGFDNNVELKKTSVLSHLGMKSGAATSIDTNKTLKEIFGDRLSSSEVSVTGADGSVTTKNAVSMSVNGKTITANDDETLKAFMTRVNNSNAGVMLSFDSISESFKLESKNTGAVNKITLDDTGNDFLKNNLKISASENNSHSLIGQDAIFTVNGSEMTRESNDVTVGGLSVKLNGATKAGETIDIEVSKNTDSTFDNIKKFVESYNTLIAGVNSAVIEKRAKRGTYDYYEPLSDEQRTALSDSDVENWEKKAKEGLLNNDKILKDMLGSFRRELYNSVDLGDGKRISLYEIGITTSSNINDRGKLVIDENKLRKALDERPSDVETLFTKGPTSGKSKSERFASEGIAERLNDILNDAVSTKGSLSIKAGIPGYSSETSNELTDQLKKQNEQLADMLISLRTKEESYYARFAKMEAAMNQSNSQMSYLQGMM